MRFVLRPFAAADCEKIVLPRSDDGTYSIEVDPQSCFLDLFPSLFTERVFLVGRQGILLSPAWSFETLRVVFDTDVVTVLGAAGVDFSPPTRQIHVLLYHTHLFATPPYYSFLSWMASKSSAPVTLGDGERLVLRDDGRFASVTHAYTLPELAARYPTFETDRLVLDVVHASDTLVFARDQCEPEFVMCFAMVHPCAPKYASRSVAD